MKVIFLSFFMCMFGLTSIAQSITAVSPSSGERATATLPITISGSGTSFSNATSTVVEIFQGTNTLQVVSVGSVQPQSVDLNIQISNVDPLGSYTVRVYDQNVGMVDLPNGFTVIPSSNPPVLLATAPNLVSETQVLPITITMDNAHFSQATSSTMYLSHSTGATIMPLPGTLTVLNDNAIRGTFDIGSAGIGYIAGDSLNSHCWNSIDGSFDDMVSITVVPSGTISGAIDYSGTYNGVVELYIENVTASPPNTYSLVATSPVSGNTYSFSDVAFFGNHLVRSVPIGMNDVVATYYVNNIDWQNASQVVCLGATNLVDLVPFSSVLASNLGITVNGALGYGPNGFNKSNIVFAEGVEVFLKDTDNNVYAQSTTDVNGSYSFSDIPEGNYEIIVDMPGYDQVSTYAFAVTAGMTDVTDLDFLIDNNEIFISGFMGVSELNKVNLEVYPNPTTGEFNIVVPENLSDFSVSIYNTVGTVVWEQAVKNNTSSIFAGDLSSLSSGVYIVKVNGGNTVSEIRLVKSK